MDNLPAKPVTLQNIVEGQQIIIEELVKNNAELKNANQLLIQLVSNQEKRLQQLEDTTYHRALDFHQPKERWWHRLLGFNNSKDGKSDYQMKTAN